MTALNHRGEEGPNEQPEKQNKFNKNAPNKQVIM